MIITTFNRAAALAETLDQLARQSLSPEKYEVIVTDDGSSDETEEVLEAAEAAYELRTIRFEHNRGISAGRNAAIRESRGDLLVMVSDDVLVPENFLAAHLEASARWPHAWIMGRFDQLGQLTDSPFGRYLEQLELSFDAARKLEPVDDGVWRLGTPTARNLSIPRAHLERIGLFDERFKTACEDQDLAHRAEPLGVQYLYDESISCVHNDQVADLSGFGAATERRTADTALFCRKHYEIHGNAPVVRLNGPIRREDGLSLALKKALKRLLARRHTLLALHQLADLAERAGAPDRVLFRLYRGVIGLHIQRGWINGSSG